MTHIEVWKMYIFLSTMYLNSGKKGSDQKVSNDFAHPGALIKGQVGVPLTVYPWYLLCSLGILGDYNP